LSEAWGLCWHSGTPLTPHPLIGIKSEVGVKSEELVVVAAFLSFLVLFSFFVKAVDSVEKVMS
jgi:hypothetical protein